MKNQGRETRVEGRGPGEGLKPVTSNQLSVGSERPGDRSHGPSFAEASEGARDARRGQESNNQSGTEEPFITKEEVARRMRKPVRTIENWMREHRIPFYRVGHSVRFRWSDVQVHFDRWYRVEAVNGRESSDESRGTGREGKAET
jgi:excisionase family DNA binding protein